MSIKERIARKIIAILTAAGIGFIWYNTALVYPISSGSIAVALIITLLVFGLPVAYLLGLMETERRDY